MTFDFFYRRIVPPLALYRGDLASKFERSATSWFQVNRKH